jgi:hypothetical protein
MMVKADVLLLYASEQDEEIKTTTSFDYDLFLRKKSEL